MFESKLTIVTVIVKLPIIKFKIILNNYRKFSYLKEKNKLECSNCQVTVTLGDPLAGHPLRRFDEVGEEDSP